VLFAANERYSTRLGAANRSLPWPAAQWSCRPEHETGDWSLGGGLAGPGLGEGLDRDLPGRRGLGRWRL